jgi:hypothetical protein
MSEEAPREEVAETSVQEKIGRRGIPREGILIGALVLGHVIFDILFFNPGPPRSRFGESLLYMTVGVIFSGPFLFALWAAFAPQRFYHRFLWSFLLCTVVFFLEDLGFMRTSGPSSGELMIVNYLFFVLGTAILSAVRRLTGWQIQREGDFDLSSVYRSHQFGIKHLLILTAITALAAGFLRTLYNINPSGAEMFVSVVKSAVVIGGYFVLLFPILVLPWFTLAYRPRKGLLATTTIILFCVCDMAAYFLIKNPLPSDWAIYLIIFLQLGGICSVLVTTLPFRFCGYRMIRMRKGTVAA